MKRREFITLLGGTAIARSLAARAQERDRVRRIGVLMAIPPDDPQSPVRIAAITLGLQQLGWTEGHNVRLEYRWPAGDPERTRQYAAEIFFGR